MTLVVKATVVLVIVLVSARLAHRGPAALRHLIVVAGFAILVVLPLAAVALPPVPMPIMTTAGPQTIVTQPTMSVAREIFARASAKAEPRRRFGWVTGLAIVSVVWLVGAIAFLLPLAFGLWQVHRLRHRAVRWPVGQRIAATIAAGQGMQARCDVLVDDAVLGPATCGTRCAAILLPLDARRWSREELDRVLLHELEHVRRADWLVQILARIVCALYWFHPLVWVALRQLELDAERACDDAVVKGADATTYAEHLVTLAERQAGCTRRPAIAMANRRQLVQRIDAILDPHRNRRRLDRRTIGFTALAAVLVVAFVSPLSPAAQGLGLGGPFIPLPMEIPSGPPVDPTLAFDVVSIRPADPRGSREGMLTQGGRLEMFGLPVQRLLLMAFGLPPDRIIGAPGWTNTERYTVLAKAPESAPPNAMPVMVTNLLKDRFKLAVHAETRVVPMFNLVRARSDGKPGPALKPTLAECERILRVRADNPATPGPAPLPGTPGGAPLFDPAAPPCGSMRSGPGILGAGGQPIARLVQMLSQVTGQPITDQTGLAGLFNFALKYTPDPSPGGNAVFIAPDADPNAPNIFTALQEQLGLKLEGVRGRVPVTVIDHIEKPALD